MHKLLFFAHDPGGAHTLLPLIEPLNEQGYNLVIYGKGPALDIIPNVIEYSQNTDDLIKRIMPDFVLTGTSANDLTEKELRKSAKKFNIPSLAILDSWINYNRFTKYSCNELNKLKSTKKYAKLEYLPDYIIVMDNYAKQEMIKEGIPENIIYPLGNPHFLFVKQKFDKLKTDNIRNELLNGKEKLILWASECLIEDYGQGFEIEALKDVIDIIPKNTQLIVKPHPREKNDKFDNFKNIENVSIIKDICPYKLIKSADLVMSMTSMVLIESIIAGKHTLSYQKNAINKDKFILTKMGALEFFNDKIELQKEIINKLENKNLNINNFKINFQASESIIQFIEEKLCQN